MDLKSYCTCLEFLNTLVWRLHSLGLGLGGCGLKFEVQLSPTMTFSPSRVRRIRHEALRTPYSCSTLLRDEESTILPAVLTKANAAL